MVPHLHLNLITIFEVAIQDLIAGKAAPLAAWSPTWFALPILS
jgi:hypothetical protein